MFRILRPAIFTADWVAPDPARLEATVDGSGTITRRALLAGATGAAAIGGVAGPLIGAGSATAAPDAGGPRSPGPGPAGPGAGAGPRPGGPARPSGLLVDLMRDPLGVGLAPRFSWIVAADQPSTRQVAYQLRIATDPASFGGPGHNTPGPKASPHEKPPLVHDTGRVASAESVAVAYTGPALSPASVYHWRVRTWSGPHPSAWSQPQRMATAADGAWNAEAIWAPDGTFTLADGRLDVELTITAVSVGLFLRARDASNAYMIQVLAGSPGRIKPHVRKGGTFTVLKEATLPVAVPTGTPLTLSVELAGDTTSPASGRSTSAGRSSVVSG